MLDVASLEKFDVLKNFVLVAGTKGLYRNISNVVILDYEGIEGDYSDFHEGDFVITNLLFAKNDTSKIYPAFKALIDIGVSAFAVKTVFFTTLPDDIIQLANYYEIPIFLFHDIFIEDVILSISDHLRSSANFNYYEDLIDSFECEHSHSSQVRQLLNSLLGTQDEFTNDMQVSSLYAIFTKPIDDFSIQRTINKLTLQAKHMKTEASLYILKYKKGILFLNFCQKLNDSYFIYNIWENIIKELNLSLYTLGMNDTLLDISKTDIAIKRCINACRSACCNGYNLTKYSELGLYNLAFSIYNDNYACEFLKEKSLCLDSEKNSTLRNTMFTLVSSNFDIDKTAATLYQHPNTVRYRISKLKELLNTNNDIEFQVISILLTKRYH